MKSARRREIIRSAGCRAFTGRIIHGCRRRSTTQTRDGNQRASSSLWHIRGRRVELQTTCTRSALELTANLTIQKIAAMNVDIQLPILQVLHVTSGQGNQEISEVSVWQRKQNGS